MLDDLINVINTLKGRIRDHRSDLAENETRTRMALFGCATTTAPAARLTFLTLSARACSPRGLTPPSTKTARLTPHGSVAWGEDDRIELCADALYLQLTGKSVEEAMPGARKIAVNA